MTLTCIGSIIFSVHMKLPDPPQTSSSEPRAYTHLHPDLRRSFAHALSLFIPCLSHTSIQIGTRLENFQRQYNIFDDSPAKGLGNILGNVDVGGLQMQGMDSVSMVDGPVTHSRAGLYIYLNALVVNRSTSPNPSADMAL